MKKVNVIYVVKKEEDKETCLTIVKNKKDAFEFTTNYLRLEKAKHFEMWCKNRGFDPTSQITFQQYLHTCIDPNYANSFRMKKVSFNLSDVTEALRMLCGFQPLGLTYEGPMETGMLISNLMTNKDEKFQELYATQARLNPLLKEIITTSLINKDGE